MIVKKATLQNLEQLVKLFDGYRVFYKKQSDIAAATTFIKERLTNNDSEIFVSEMTNGNLSGFTQLYPLFSSTKMKRYWLLNDLFVANEYRGKGISISLIERAKQLVMESNACGMYLETEKTNVIGNQLYPRIGFTLNSVSNYYEWLYEK